ncbi:MAG: hypothetical protein DI538_07240 [Azospira oryzae]|jgi:hypothetical protein|nr:MAG: hypothetical protein DI538_07240 [Azospira oryzae]
MRPAVLRLGDLRKKIDIPVDVYNSLQKFIVAALMKEGEISLNELLDSAGRSRRLKYEGDLFWCLMQVKQDLVNRKIIAVDIGLGRDRTQMIRLLEVNPKPMKLVKNKIRKK